MTPTPVWLLLCYSTLVFLLEIDSCLIPKRGLFYPGVLRTSWCVGLIQLVPSNADATLAQLCFANAATAAAMVTFFLDDKRNYNLSICSLLR